MDMTEGAVGAIAQLAQASSKVQTVVSKEGREYAVLTKMDGARLVQSLQLLTDERTIDLAPARINRDVTITSKDSFVDYVNRFAEPGASIFASLQENTFKAFLDYPVDAAAPRTPNHTAKFSLILSEEWKRWNKIDGVLMKQAEFARWLEENMADIESPSGADVLEVVRDISAARKVDFKQSVRLDNGDVGFEYVEETQAKSKSGVLEVPRAFMLRLPVWYGEPAVHLQALFRWKLEEATLTMGVELHRKDYVKQACFEQIGLDIQVRVSKPVYYGAGER